MNISQYNALSAAKFSLKEQRCRHVGLSFTASNAHKASQKQTLGFFLISKRSPFGGNKMKMIVDGKYLESEDNEITISETENYWDIEDRLYEQYKEKRKVD
jgi:hypothetical protein